MQFCGLTILTTKKYSKAIAAAERAQRRLNSKLVAELLNYNATQIQKEAIGLVDRELRHPRRP